MKDFFDLNNPDYAYMLGLFQTDGSLSKSTRNRGHFSIEMSFARKPLLEKIAKLIPYNTTIGDRTRDTNFQDNYHSVFLRVCNWEFRTIINSKGVPYGRKSEIIKPPIGKFSEPDYYRGLIDGDGSIGITQRNLPFISLTTASQDLCDAYIAYIYKHTGSRKVVNRNKRDDIYNIISFREPSQTLAKLLYYESCNLCIEEKKKNSRLVTQWQRSSHLPPYVHIKYWEDWEVEFILSHSIEDSMKKLERTKQSVKMKLWRLANNK